MCICLFVISRSNKLMLFQLIGVRLAISLRNALLDGVQQVVFYYKIIKKNRENLTKMNIHASVSAGKT